MFVFCFLAWTFIVKRISCILHVCELYQQSIMPLKSVPIILNYDYASIISQNLLLST